MKLISLLLVDLGQQVMLPPRDTVARSCSLFPAFNFFYAVDLANRTYHLLMPDRAGWGCPSQPALSHPPGLQFLGQVWALDSLLGPAGLSILGRQAWLAQGCREEVPWED